ncbi:hypothetical protein C805_03014 [Eubacterium sp. 14-2]|uniref:hypothetical protein n=1 Tax=Eubacterium sp. 14-2 TaxID=1235790 RepID=UPI00033C778D|nr:hypothetical protein [Eubacterium sp. 14-2]EOT23355.1 hypothetical protein C805_03014 [Eubacterium sp. 14-2]
MKKELFKDLLFQILNENDTFLKNIELDDTNDTLIIQCIDGSKFSLHIHEPFSQFLIQDFTINHAYLENYNNQKSAYLDEVNMLAQENPFVFLIFIVILKLSELDIISEQNAHNLMTKLQPHAQELKEQWNRTICH